MIKKALVFDSSTLINLASNGLLDVLVNLKKIFDGNFYITESVEYEVVEHPINIKKFELNALKLKNLIGDCLTMPEENNEISTLAKEIMESANHTFKARFKEKEEYVHLIDSGEASCLALSRLLSKKGVKNLIVIDERTTRMLGENPENLRKLFEKKFHTKVSSSESNYSTFKGFSFIRSSELMYIAYKKGMIELGNNTLDAVLYATKFHGASISRSEIETMKKL
ncbi:hypothetical protein COV15_00985 [Candidatus Woesearchaeota archaeon CG10_big_fil_rev_8_21_14_0_10_34_12]|nr:MAG: hypothetical protein COV15_00985 [Candidatus Woesearchaeota archaeon CG10_big_fil_rev_8_21_14_0_10_34_12]